MFAFLFCVLCANFATFALMLFYRNVHKGNAKNAREFSNTFLAFIFFLLVNGVLFAQPNPYQATVYKPVLKGYYFLYTFKMRQGAELKENCQMIMDENGHTLYYQVVKRASDFKVHKNGKISFWAIDSTFHILDHHLKWIDTIKCANGIETDPHDLQILANNHYLLIGKENVSMDLSAYRFMAKSNAPGSKTANVQANLIQELDENKKLVFEWHAKDHFQFTDTDPFYIKDTAFLDWNHINSVEEDFDGNLLVSIRNFHEITKISRKDGSVMWRFGGRRNQFRILNDSIPFLSQHDARRIANGILTIYDNGFGEPRKNHFTRGVEYRLDEVNKTATLVWSYTRNPPIVCERTGNMQ